MLAAALSCKKPEKLPSEKQILVFELPTYPSAVVSIDQQTGIINVSVAYGSALSGLVPQISISQGAMIVPAASVPQDFSRHVAYTVTAADGSKKVYTIKVSTLPETPPVITGFSRDTVRAGEAVELVGKHFDGFVSAIQLALVAASGQETKVNFRLADSTRLTLTIPETTEPGAYRVKMVKSGTQTVSSRSLVVSLAMPVISTLKRQNILEGDTLIVAGRFLWPQKYDYRLILIGDKGDYAIKPVEKGEAKLVVALFDPNRKRNVPPGRYTVSVDALGTGAYAGLSDSIRVYSDQLPFVTGFIKGQNTYRGGETAAMATRAFEKLDARFYQVQLSGQSVQYNQNGIYSAASRQLSVNLPAEIKPGTYAVRITYLSDSGQALYDQDLDDIITIIQ